VPGNQWMTCVGRIAFPIFAFQLVEGYFHTKSLKKYLLRMLAFAIISEIPFDLMTAGTVFYPFHQNVIFTLLIGLLMIAGIEKVRQKNRVLLTIAAGTGIAAAACLAAAFGFVDYMWYGILTVLIFYVFRGFNGAWIFQLIGLFLVNGVLFEGIEYAVSVFGLSFFVQGQAFAVLALIPIWLYNGKKGFDNKFAQYSFYVFYPLHMLILGLIMRLG
ncbi:MAG: TraX family protein, partial [Oscillospiraceae bacterium]